jgi:DNA-binding MarR family transcriptional regulator
MLAPMPKLDRLTLATKFAAALQDVSRRNPTAWRRVSAIGARTGIKGDQLDEVVADLVAAGLVERRADSPILVKLTTEGWAIARD